MAIDTLFSGTEKQSLVVVVGNNAHLAVEPLRQKSIYNVLAVNTSCYNTDSMANNFLSEFYKLLFLGFPVQDAFGCALEESTTHTERNKLNDICCCLHEH